MVQNTQAIQVLVFLILHLHRKSFNPHYFFQRWFSFEELTLIAPSGTNFLVLIWIQSLAILGTVESPALLPLLSRLSWLYYQGGTEDSIHMTSNVRKCANLTLISISN